MSWWEQQGKHRGRLEYHYRRCRKGDIDASFLDRLWEIQDGRCAYCESTMDGDDAVIEHMRPVTRGGKNTQDNVCWACSDCNGRKYIKTYDEFLADPEGPQPFRGRRKKRTKRKREKWVRPPFEPKVILRKRHPRGADGTEATAGSTR